MCTCTYPTLKLAQHQHPGASYRIFLGTDGQGVHLPRSVLDGVEVDQFSASYINTTLLLQPSTLYFYRGTVFFITFV